MRVLLVEDHADTRDLYTSYLSDQGFVVETAATGLQAVDMALAAPPDVIVLDLQLPGMDGWSAAQYLKSNQATRHVSIVAVSAHAFPEDEARARQAGCDAFLAKPFLPTDLVRTILGLCPRKEWASPGQDGERGSARKP